MTQAREKLEFSVSGSIADIPEPEWIRLFGDKCAEGYGYHKTLEETRFPGFSLGYLVARRGAGLVAAIPFFLTDFSADMLVPEPLHKPAEKLKRFLTFKVLFLGSPTTEELYLGIAKDEELKPLLESALEKINEFSRQKKIHLVTFYNLSQKKFLFASYLRDKGFIEMENLPGTILEIRAGSLEDYIKGLSRNTRKDLRRKLKKSAELAQLTTQVRRDIDGIEDRIYELYMHNFDDSGIHFEVLTPEFFRAIFRNMPQETRIFITYDGAKIVAFNLCMIKDDLCIDKFIGFDPEVAHKYHLYFTTFCHNIDWCIKNGLRYYQPGATDYRPKLRLGAKLIPLFIYVKAFNPLLHLFLRAFSRIIQPKNIDTTWKSA